MLILTSKLVDISIFYCFYLLFNFVFLGLFLYYKH
nr:MAG TPA: hypothetical protein [Caudoviricetes sp.]